MLFMIKFASYLIKQNQRFCKSNLISQDKKFSHK